MTAVITKPLPPALIKTKVEGIKLISPLATEVEGLSIVTADDLQGADEILAGIQAARKTWKAKMEKILAPLRSAKSEADALNREVDRPLEQLEAQVKSKIRDYRLEESRQIAEARRVQEAAEARLAQQIEETAQKEQAARTKQMRERLTNKRQALENQAEEVEAAREVVQTAHSTARAVRKWRVVNKRMAIQGLMAIDGRESFIELNTVAINKVPLEEIEEWPGFEVYNDIVIAGR